MIEIAGGIILAVLFFAFLEYIIRGLLILLVLGIIVGIVCLLINVSQNPGIIECIKYLFIVFFCIFALLSIGAAFLYVAPHFDKTAAQDNQQATDALNAINKSTDTNKSIDAVGKIKS